MNLYTYSTYKLDTGLFTGTTYTCLQNHLEVNVPEDCGCLLGVYDMLSQKVDVETGLVVDYTPPAKEEPSEVLIEKIKTKRKELLAETDWLAVRAYEGIEMPEAWKTYRQQLRDITKQEGFPQTIEWPSKPT